MYVQRFLTKLMVLFSVALVVSARRILRSNYLSTQGEELSLDGQKVFLVGETIEWQSDVEAMFPAVQSIKEAGGNTIRVMLPNGRYMDGSFVTDLARFLTRALEHNVIVIPVLWDGAALTKATYLRELIDDDAALKEYGDTYFRHVLRVLRPYQSFGAWEILASPEALIEELSLLKVQRFTNHLSALVHEEDEKALVAVSTANANLFNDRSLVLAGGKKAGTVDLILDVSANELQKTLGKPVIRAAGSCHGLDVSASASGVLLQRDVKCGVKSLGNLANDAPGKIDFVFPPQKMTRSWGKRPELLYNPDEMLAELLRKEQEEKEDDEEFDRIIEEMRLKKQKEREEEEL